VVNDIVGGPRPAVPEKVKSKSNIHSEYQRDYVGGPRQSVSGLKASYVGVCEDAGEVPRAENGSDKESSDPNSEAAASTVPTMSTRCDGYKKAGNGSGHSDSRRQLFASLWFRALIG
jgi:hypothetical protein